MRIFLTGHLGYIGVHLVRQLKSAGHFVAGCDSALFAGCEFEDFERPDLEYIKDFRALTLEELNGYDCLMHLAAISNDPMGDLDQKITYGINLEGTVALAGLAKRAGIKRFLFSGSCSVYGKGVKADLEETDEVKPVSAYAISKIESEKQISAMADENFTPVYLRNATAYGFSPMLRIDLVVNNLLACAHTMGSIKMMSDGTPWRPLIHCSDIAKAFVALMDAPKEKIFNKAINIGANEENYQVRDVAEMVQRFIPGVDVEFTGEAGEDPRNYRVNFDLLYQILPNFKLDYNLLTGTAELYEKYKENKFNKLDFEGDRFVRLRTLKNRIGGMHSI